MKKQVMTLAAMMIASNVAFAGVSQQSVKLSEDSIKSVLTAGEVLASGSVTFSKDGFQLSKEAVKGTLKLAGESADSTSKNVKSAASKVSTAAKTSAASTSGGISAAAEFTVEKVESAASASGHSIKVTLKKLVDGTVVVATFSYDASKAVGKAMISTASALFIVGKTVVIATSNAGVVLVTDSANGTKQVLDGHIKNGSSTIIASISDSSKAFGSTMVEGLHLKK